MFGQEQINNCASLPDNCAKCRITLYLHGGFRGGRVALKPVFFFRGVAYLFGSISIYRKRPDSGRLETVFLFGFDLARHSTIVRCVCIRQTGVVQFRVLLRSRWCHFLLKNKKITAYRTLKDLESELPESLFCRTHHSYLVNMQHIERWERTGRNGLIYLPEGLSVYISVLKMEHFEEKFGTFLLG